MPACDTSLVGLTSFPEPGPPGGKAGLLTHVLSVAFPAHVCTVRKEPVFQMRFYPTVSCNHIIPVKGYILSYNSHRVTQKNVKTDEKFHVNR